MKEAVIFIPGIMGSELKDGNELVWPGSPYELIFPYKHMESLRKPNLTVGDIIRRVSISAQYDELIESLASCGFQEGAEGNLRVLPYDWRKCNTLAAAKLADLVDGFTSELGEECAVTLIAHSMGGLISRCYLESGKYNDRPGFNKVACLITMGTPHRGAPMALSAAVGQEKRLFLNAAQVHEIANNPEFPSLYQLLPPRYEPFAWNRHVEAKYLPEDIYDSQTASNLKLSGLNLKSAEAFHQMLDISRRPAKVRYFFFAGTRERTVSSVQLDRSGDKVIVRKNERDDGGDGTVPFWSGFQTSIQTEAVGGEHGGIYKNSVLKTILGGLLGKPGVLKAAGAVPEVSVNPPVIYTDDIYRLTIDLPINTRNVTGVIKLKRRVTEQGEVADADTYTSSVQVNYTGPEIDHLTVVLTAPSYRGIYEIEYIPSEGTVSSKPATLFVQERIDD